ncbi:thermonuclease family protein [Curvibacter delicatus]|uniref:thermonuclease family protein n=1 Tax=Curvibacter delicatus TaxID=80879 RepID=UPI000AE81CD8|nr:thermonuclease family protein [Curvibacter delicatus]
MKVGLRLAIAASLCWVLAAHALSYEGLVVKVKDGDTVTLLDSDKRSHEVRLAGIDAPEKKQAFGQRSKQSLSDLAYMQKATVDFDKKDRYGREVGKILVNERDVNLEQIKRGMAWVYRQYQRELSKEDRVLYDHAEGEAKLSVRGLWADAAPTPPWDFRQAQKSD